MPRSLACLLCLIFTLSACAGVSDASAAELHVLARNPEGVRTDDPAWLSKLSQASGVPVRFAAAVSARRAAYRIACDPDTDSCSVALSRLAASGLLDQIETEGRKTLPSPPASATLH
ncbi:hypothetical protein [Niveibacterium terrae]|uniref:hypothetical protein n=1 Tax=Niveibacterium terrae TaxID=3373598 RepID=UPI003A912C76